MLSVTPLLITKLTNMGRLFLLFVFSFFLLPLTNAQNIANEQGIKEGPLIGDMMERYVEINKSTPTLEGWRIQLLATTDRQKMETTRQNFQYRYPNIPVTWEHSRPYYKLRAGAFETKLEAIRLLYLLKKDYPSAYPAKDKNIRPEELVGYY